MWVTLHSLEFTVSLLIAHCSILAVKNARCGGWPSGETSEKKSLPNYYTKDNRSKIFQVNVCFQKRSCLQA